MERNETTIGWSESIIRVTCYAGILYQEPRDGRRVKAMYTCRLNTLSEKGSVSFEILGCTCATDHFISRIWLPRPG